ncbi:hypothetical protein E2C01_091196 [Portunus trituberculatus]|uniref:Uncharacterized protein n=1 Tax=Portunus trituberculatus TaxID=210409 RepID=A0A5B7JNR5_PORTR|nr:hypothetical protein [Portunus trituberculatus]
MRDKVSGGVARQGRAGQGKQDQTKSEPDCYMLNTSLQAHSCCCCCCCCCCCYSSSSSSSSSSQVGIKTI